MDRRQRRWCRVALGPLAAALMVVLAGAAGAGAPARTSTRPLNYCAQQNALFRGRYPYVGITDGSVEVASNLNCSLGQMAAHHIGYFRGAIRWDGVEWAPGRYVWTTLDSIVADIARHHMHFLPGLLGAPRWLSTDPARDAADTYPPADPAQFAQFAALCVRRYGPGGSFWRANPRLPYYPIRAWQIWNEQNLAEYWAPAPNLRAYVALLRAAYVAIKRVDPRALVLTGGMPFFSPADQTRALTQMYRFGARGHFDVLAIHPYSATVKQAIARVWAARRVLARFGDARKPLWITEFAWAGGDPDAFIANPAKQRLEIQRFFVWIERNRARVRLQRVFWYGWVDEPPPPGTTDPGWWGYHLGMFTSSLTPKPALAALSTAAARLDRCPLTQAVAVRGPRVICVAARRRRRP